MILTNDRPPPLTEQDIAAVAPSQQELVQLMAKANIKIAELEEKNRELYHERKVIRYRLNQALGCLNTASPFDDPSRFVALMMDLRTEVGHAVGLLTAHKRKGER